MTENITEEKKYKGPIAWMAQNPVASNLLMIAILAGGIAGIFKVNQEVFPEFDLDMISIEVPYPGASPQETEQGIVLAVEEAVRGLDGVKRVSADAREGTAGVTVELLLGVDNNKVLQDVKNAVDRITSFPEQTEKPKVSLLVSRSRVISMVFHGNKTLKELHNIAEKARSELLRTDGITQVDLDGVPPLEISIEIPQSTLETLGLTLERVAREIKAASVEIPGGSVKTKGGEVLVRVADRRRSGHEFADLILRSTKDGSEIRLGDIATIKDTYQESDTASYFNEEPAVRLTIYRIGKETPRSVSNLVHEYKSKIEKTLPSGIKVDLWSDDSEMLTSRMDLLTRNAIFGFVLVFIILALFLNLRLAFWVSIGIPICFLGAFAFLPAGDISINMISLFAFIITLGMVVDDAIVVGENIFEKMQAGVPRIQASIEGTREMVMPVTFSVLTTMAAFAPLFFVPGVMGKIFKLMPFIVIAVLGISLIECFFILPAHLSHSRAQLGKKTGNAKEGTFAIRWSGGVFTTVIDLFAFVVAKIQRPVALGFEFFTARIYAPILRWVLTLRYITAAFAIASLAGGVGLVLGGFVPFNFFPKLEGDLVQVTARLPFGTPLERTMEVQRVLEASAEKAIAQNGGKSILRGMYTRLGQGPTAGRGPHAGAQGAGGSHLVTIEMSLVPSDQRSSGSEKISDDWSRLTPQMPGIEAIVFSSSSGPGAGAAVDVQLSHEKMAVLEKASNDLAAELGGFADLTNIDNSFSEGKTQFDFHLRPEARTLGLSSLDIANQIRSAFFGAEAIREQRGRNEIRVMVRFPKENRVSEFDIETMMIQTASGGRVPLKYVASYERDVSPTSIKREEGRRITNVTAELGHGVHSVDKVLVALRTKVLPKLMEKYPDLEWDMAGQQRERADSFKALGVNFIFALFIIYGLIAIPFRSYAQPLIIMSAIPFGFLGAMIGHLVMGYDITIISMFGIVALAGVVVNDSIVLVDAVNKSRAAGSTVLTALMFAGTRRLRPIFLTSVTTFLGLAPMILEKSLQARFMVPMAISLGFGVMFATFIILLLVPAFYLILEDVKGLFRTKENRAQ